MRCSRLDPLRFRGVDHVHGDNGFAQIKKLAREVEVPVEEAGRIDDGDTDIGAAPFRGDGRGASPRRPSHRGWWAARERLYVPGRSSETDRDIASG
ncbi:MAG: hypothetical protein U0792_18305 [Gemmataceae bacterium]